MLYSCSKSSVICLIYNDVVLFVDLSYVFNVGKAIMVWERHSGPTPTEKTGPDNDHTFERYNSSGHYLFVNMNQHAGRKISGFASNAVINSIVFNPPPYAHLNTSSIYQQTCMVRNHPIYLSLSLAISLFVHVSAFKHLTI